MTEDLNLNAQLNWAIIHAKTRMLYIKLCVLIGGLAPFQLSDELFLQCSLPKLINLDQWPQQFWNYHFSYQSFRAESSEAWAACLGGRINTSIERIQGITRSTNILNTFLKPRTVYRSKIITMIGPPVTTTQAPDNYAINVPQIRGGQWVHG